MKNTVLKFLIILGSTISSLHGMNYVVEGNAPKTFDGKEITAQSLLNIAPQIPADVNNAVQEWLTENPQFAETALDYKPFIDIRSQHMATNKLLMQLGLSNQSLANYIFPINAKWMLKVAGQVNRRENLNRLLAFFDVPHQWGRALTAQDYEVLKQNLKPDELDTNPKTGETAPKTYQTISNLATYLLFLEAKKQHAEELAPVNAPEMYLAHIPGRPVDLSDRNYVLVERRINGLTEVKALTEKERHAIETVIRLTGLFDLSKGNLRRAPDGSLYIYDFEQPNNSSPRFFFNKYQNVFDFNVQAGLDSFKENFPKEQQ